MVLQQPSVKGTELHLAEPLPKAGSGTLGEGEEATFRMTRDRSRLAKSIDVGLSRRRWVPSVRIGAKPSVWVNDLRMRPALAVVVNTCIVDDNAAVCGQSMGTRSGVLRCLWWNFLDRKLLGFCYDPSNGNDDWEDTHNLELEGFFSNIRAKP